MVSSCPLSFLPLPERCNISFLSILIPNMRLKEVGEKSTFKTFMSTYDIDRRLMSLDTSIQSSVYSKQKSSLEREFRSFLSEKGKLLEDANPVDIRRFLVDKDRHGRTKVHDVSCPFLGQKRANICSCPSRLAAGTVESMVGKLKSIFDGLGKDGGYKGVFYDNPACAPSVKMYVKAIKLEQAKSHVTPQQAKPLFLGKLRSISEYMRSILGGDEPNMAKTFVLHRDHAFFTVQFFAGDRASDLGLTVTQEIKRLHDDSGLVFTHTVGKTLGNGKKNQFAVVRVKDEVVCPVRALERYVECAKDMGVDLSSGYLFRPLDDSRSEVLEAPVSYSLMYDRLKVYLKALGLDEGETPHSIRGGCAVTLALSGAGKSVADIMDHIGWFGESSAHRYSRIHEMVDKGSVANLFASTAMGTAHSVERIFEKYGDLGKLRSAFQ